MVSLIFGLWDMRCFGWLSSTSPPGKGATQKSETGAVYPPLETYITRSFTQIAAKAAKYAASILDFTRFHPQTKVGYIKYTTNYKKLSVCFWLSVFFRGWCLVGCVLFLGGGSVRFRLGLGFLVVFWRLVPLLFLLVSGILFGLRVLFAWRILGFL